MSMNILNRIQEHFSKSHFLIHTNSRIQFMRRILEVYFWWSVIKLNTIKETTITQSRKMVAFSGQAYVHPLNEPHHFLWFLPLQVRKSKNQTQMIWMKLRKSPAKANGIYRMKDADPTSLPLFALQGLYAPTVFYAFIFLAVREKNETTNTTYVYTWICLLSDECFVSLWNIPQFTLCTSLNKVYEFFCCVS